ncbi:MAG TPA: 5'-nucleotidase [Bacteroidia bacterium]|nr:5'-nucleotidase [Bacteroidia bacterium]
MRFTRFVFPALFPAAILASACHPPAHVTQVDAQYVQMDAKTDQHDSVTAAIIAPYRVSMEKEMDEVLVKSDSAMTKDGTTESKLGNFVADVCLTVTNDSFGTNGHPAADICLFNNGGLRSSLPAGNITRGNIFELMPFDNEIVILTLSGQKMWQLIRYVCATGGEPEAGMKLGIRPDKTPGSVLIGGVPFDSTRTYKVLTSDYLANGGDKMNFFSAPLDMQTTGYRIRDALINYCVNENKKGHTLSSRLDGRIYYETK